MFIASMCLRLAMMPESNEQVPQAGNHVHFADWTNDLEPGSDDFIIVYKPDLL
jgi:hypothetical protein